MNTILNSTSAILGLINSTVASAKGAVELAKKTKNSELKEQVNEVIDGILSLKGTVLDLEEENRLLKAKLLDRGTITRNPQFGYWFKEGESDPLCPKCYEGNDNHVAYLSPIEPMGSFMGRRCRVCGWRNAEARKDNSDPRVIATGGIASRMKGYL